jgi:hypothetical protein
LQVYAFGDSS